MKCPRHNYEKLALQEESHSEIEELHLGRKGDTVYWEGGHCTYLLDGGNIWVGAKTYTGRGTPHIICCWGNIWGGDTTLH